MYVYKINLDENLTEDYFEEKLSNYEGITGLLILTPLYLVTIYFFICMRKSLKTFMSEKLTHQEK